MKSYIQLDNLVFYAYHGVLPQETVVGNTFIVNLKIRVDFMEACISDDLSHTISYADVYHIIKREIDIPSKLLEHVAYRILKAIRSEYSQIEEIELKLSKRNPPIGGQMDYASIILID